MNAEERLALIRAQASGAALAGRYRATGIHCAGSGLPPTPAKRMGMGPLDKAKAKAYGVADLGYQPRVMGKAEWLNIPAKKKVRHCRVKRTKKVSPLTNIMKAWEDPETFRS